MDVDVRLMERSAMTTRYIAHIGSSRSPLEIRVLGARDAGKARVQTEDADGETSLFEGPLVAQRPLEGEAARWMGTLKSPQGALSIVVVGRKGEYPRRLEGWLQDAAAGAQGAFASIRQVSGRGAAPLPGRPVRVFVADAQSPLGSAPGVKWLPFVVVGSLAAGAAWLIKGAS